VVVAGHAPGWRGGFEVSERPADVEAATCVAAFKALGDARRLRVLRTLLEVPDTLCGCEIADVLGLEDYQVSRALKPLRDAGLVREQARTGTWVHYAAARGDDPTTDAILDLVTAVPLDRDERDRLELRYGLREQAGCVLGPGHPTVLATLQPWAGG
jgi:ArsR family transcriptional regulator, arsenate/arsenite/antimonite-responsive transcriptional repressor